MSRSFNELEREKRTVFCMGDDLFFNTTHEWLYIGIDVIAYILEELLASVHVYDGYDVRSAYHFNDVSLSVCLDRIGGDQFISESVSNCTNDYRDLEFVYLCVRNASEHVSDLGSWGELPRDGLVRYAAYTHIIVYEWADALCSRFGLLEHVCPVGPEGHYCIHKRGLSLYVRRFIL